MELLYDRVDTCMDCMQGLEQCLTAPACRLYDITPERQHPMLHLARSKHHIISLTLTLVT